MCVCVCVFIYIYMASTSLHFDDRCPIRRVTCDVMAMQTTMKWEVFC